MRFCNEWRLIKSIVEIVLGYLGMSSWNSWSYKITYCLFCCVTTSALHISSTDVARWENLRIGCCGWFWVDRGAWGARRHCNRTSFWPPTGILCFISPTFSWARFIRWKAVQLSASSASDSFEMFSSLTSCNSAGSSSSNVSSPSPIWLATAS